MRRISSKSATCSVFESHLVVRSFVRYTTNGLDGPFLRPFPLLFAIIIASSQQAGKPPLAASSSLKEEKELSKASATSVNVTVLKHVGRTQGEALGWAQW